MFGNRVCDRTFDFRSELSGCSTGRVADDFVLPKGAQIVGTRAPKFAPIREKQNPPQYDANKWEALRRQAKASRSKDIIGYKGMSSLPGPIGMSVC